MIGMRLLLVAAALVVLAGCQRPVYERTIVAPYGERQVWAVVPLDNETGTRHADGLAMADELARALEQVDAIDVLPVNRVLAAMDALKMPRIETRDDAIALREALGVDALVVGTMTHYDSYDPPKLGLMLDLYAWPGDVDYKPIDIRRLSWTPVGDLAGVKRGTLYSMDQPVTSVSGYFDGAGIGTKELIDRYAYGRGPTPNALHERRKYLINMNLFQEFVAHEMGSQVIWAEWKRMAQAIRAERRQAAAQQQPANP